MKRPSPFLLERYFDAREFATPWLLCASDCETRSVGELLSLEPGALERLLALDLGYGTSRGPEELRALIGGFQSGLSADDVVVHSGGEEVILTFCLAELEAGDHVIVHSPCYQSLLELPRSIGCRVSTWSADLSRGGALDLDRLADLLSREKTRAVFVNFPHNPTGFLPSITEWQQLVKLVGESGARLFSDEAYRGSARHDQAELPSAPTLDERACSLGLVSKALGLPGLRLGWAVSRDEDLLARMTAMKDYSTICSSRISEELACTALRNAAQILGETRERLATNRQAAARFFEAHSESFEYQEPIAGPICFPRLRHGTASDFADRVLAECGVILLPGDVFEGGAGHLRFGLGRKNAPECFDRLASCLSRN